MSSACQRPQEVALADLLQQLGYGGRNLCTVTRIELLPVQASLTVTGCGTARTLSASAWPYIRV